MASAYLLQIVYADGSRPTQFLAGGQGERDIVDALTKAILSRKVGFLRTEAQVRRAIEAGIHEVFHGLKAEARPVR